MIWTCHCGGEGIAFRPGTEPEIAPGGFVVSRGEPALVLCLTHFQRSYGPVQGDLLDGFRA
jgi:hypothetical protein